MVTVKLSNHNFFVLKNYDCIIKNECRYTKNYRPYYKR